MNRGDGKAARPNGSKASNFKNQASKGVLLYFAVEKWQWKIILGYTEV